MSRRLPEHAKPAGEMNPPPRRLTIATPCIRLCTLDPETRTCLGCGRTLDEIAAWTRYSEAEREAIMARLPERLKAMGHDTIQSEAPPA